MVWFKNFRRISDVTEPRLPHQDPFLSVLAVYDDNFFIFYWRTDDFTLPCQASREEVPKIAKVAFRARAIEDLGRAWNDSGRNNLTFCPVRVCDQSDSTSRPIDSRPLGTVSESTLKTRSQFYTKSKSRSMLLLALSTAIITQEDVAFRGWSRYSPDVASHPVTRPWSRQVRSHPSEVGFCRHRLESVICAVRLHPLHHWW